MLISILKKLCKSHIYLIVILIVYLLANNIISAQELPDDPTELSIEELSTLDAFPKNTLTFHTHLAKELMFSYKYIFMQMKGNRDGTNKVSNERDDTPAGSNQKLPYPMQLGSGTIDLLPAIIYIGQTDKFQYLK